MINTTDTTTLVGLFHTQAQASDALSDFQTAGVPAQAIQTFGGEGNRGNTQQEAVASLTTLKVPAEDLRVLSDGLNKGGTVIVVRAQDGWLEVAERVFAHHNADKIDEKTMDTKAPAANVTGETVIPIVEEELSVGKRQVKRGGVRVFSRVIETPVEEDVVLREEHATIERHAVNRPISEAELDSLQSQSIEVLETGEEAVVGKSARVVEEVEVGKETTERTQKIYDKVRRTQVEVESLSADTEFAQRKN